MLSLDHRVLGIIVSGVVILLALTAIIIKYHKTKKKGKI